MVDSWVAEAEKIQNDALGVRKTIGEIITGLGLDDITSSSGTLSASIQGVSEETASLVAGQMNAIRSNQRRHIELLEMINDNISSGKVASSVQVFLPNGDKAETSKMVFQMKDYSPVLDGMTDSLFKIVENTSYNRNLESIAKDIHSMSLRPSGSGTADMSSLRASGIKY
ncbi:MAG: hypothetical protein PHD21_07400, partial [Flavobacteriales bacterium]|nr:hypothetical protein [Flavobacteriales bacterium]